VICTELADGIYPLPDDRWDTSDLAALEFRARL
jgi:hypothetical protein